MKNKQHIEEYIHHNRPDFDTAIPDDCRWQDVSGTLTRLQASGCPIEAFVAIERPVLDTEWPDTTAIWGRIATHLDKLEQPSATSEDTLESFISGNRAGFDTEMPDLRVWNELVRTQPQPAAPLRISWHNRLARAAAAIALVVSGAALGLWYAGSQQGSGAAPTAQDLATAGMRMSDVSKEYADLESQYERDIQQKKAALARFASNPSTSEVFVDMEQMDKIMEELRLELSNVPPGNREHIIRVMIENYKSKAQVLGKVLEALQSNPTQGGREQQKQQDEQDTII